MCVGEYWLGTSYERILWVTETQLSPAGGKTCGRGYLLTSMTEKSGGPIWSIWLDPDTRKTLSESMSCFISWHYCLLFYFHFPRNYPPHGDPWSQLGKATDIRNFFLNSSHKIPGPEFITSTWARWPTPYKSLRPKRWNMLFGRAQGTRQSWS